VHIALIDSSRPRNIPISPDGMIIALEHVQKGNTMVFTMQTTPKRMLRAVMLGLLCSTLVTIFTGCASDDCDEQKTTWQTHDQVTVEERTTKDVYQPRQ
jgi:hypothetical protein